LLITGVGLVTGGLLNQMPAVREYNPLSLAAENMNLVTDATEPSSLFPALWVTGFLSIGFVLAPAGIFGKKQL
jgi:hypothetical protein